MRDRLVAGNWKMNQTPTQTDVFIKRFLELVDSNHATEILLLPPFTSLNLAGKLLAHKTSTLNLVARLPEKSQQRCYRHVIVHTF